MKQQQRHHWPQLPGWPQLPVKIPWLVAQPHVPAQIWLPGEPPPPPGMPYWRLDAGFGEVRWLYEVRPVTQVDFIGESPASKSARAWAMLYGRNAPAPPRPYGLTRDDDEWIARQWALTEDPLPTPAAKRRRDVPWVMAVVLGAIMFCLPVVWTSQMHGFADYRHGRHHEHGESGFAPRPEGRDFPGGPRARG
ncbi:MAG: hypothetical protein WA890_22600 [Micromonospora sp.]